MLYLELFLTFFKIGLFTIGGGYAMLPLIQADVQAKGWMTAEELVNFIAVSESTPGHQQDDEEGGQRDPEGCGSGPPEPGDAVADEGG